jgi:hypothetical protein
MVRRMRVETAKTGRLRLPRPICARRIRVIVLGARLRWRSERVTAGTSSLASGRENVALWTPVLESIPAPRGNA